MGPDGLTLLAPDARRGDEPKLAGASLLGHLLRSRLDSTSLNARLASKVRGLERASIKRA